MSIRIYDRGIHVPNERFVFPGGEVQVRAFVHNNPNNDIKILATLKDSDDVMELLLVTDAVRQQIGDRAPIHLVMPYVPYARQDRVMNRGESLSIKVFCNLINSQNYASVTIHDPHSDVTPALLNNVKVVSQAEVLVTELPFGNTQGSPAVLQNNRVHYISDLAKNTVLVSPDAGANKKIGEIAKRLEIEHVVRADKVRDTKTGKILETVVYSDHVGDKDFLIVDDICDRGRTFVELAKVLRPLTNGKIVLYVTHAILPDGPGVFKGLIDEMYCSNSFENYPPNVNLLEGLNGS